MLMLFKKQKRCSEIVLLAIGYFPVLMLYFEKSVFPFFYFHSVKKFSCYNKRTYLCLEFMRIVFFSLFTPDNAKATAVSQGYRP